MRVPIILIGLGLALGVAFIVGPVQAQTNDHLKCYQIRGGLTLKGRLDIETPQFGLERGCKIVRPKFFCAPATKSNVDVIDRQTLDPITPVPFSAAPAPGDRLCWTVNCPQPFPSDQVVTDQFGTQTLTRFRPKLLCGPAVKGSDPSVKVFRGFPATGQMTCWDSGGSVVACAGTGTGQDGDIRAGAILAYANGDETITDLNTGLMWEKKDDNNVGGIHDKDNTYIWDDAFVMHVAELNSVSFAGYTDWRVPNYKELVSILDFETANPAVDPVFNTDCEADCTVSMCSCTVPSFYWSSSTPASLPFLHWGVTFSAGSTDAVFPNSLGFVRAVRGGL